VDAQQTKRRLIDDCLRSKPVNVAELRRLALTSGGLLTDELRYRAWPKLLEVNVFALSDFRKTVHENKDTDQIQRDIDRSMWHFSCHKNMAVEERTTQREILSTIINAIVCEHPSLNYYQGYHDVVTVFLMVLGEQRAYQLVEKASLHFFRESMRPDFKQVTLALQLIMPLFQIEDPEFHKYLVASEVEPFFALPWLITWFAHHLTDLSKVTRIYDAFLSAHPLFPLYFCAVVALSRRDTLLREVECEFAMVHCHLTKLPQDMPIEDFLEQALDMFERTSPEDLIRRYARPKLDFPKESEWLHWDWVTPQQQPDSVLWAEARGKKRPRRRINDTPEAVGSSSKRRAGKRAAFYTASVLVASFAVGLVWHVAELTGGVV
jgi:hypothetical protein